MLMSIRAETPAISKSLTRGVEMLYTKVAFESTVRWQAHASFLLLLIFLSIFIMLRTLFIEVE